MLIGTRTIFWFFLGGFLATLLERVNYEIFKVNLKSIFLIFLWVSSCYIRPGCVLYVCVNWKTTIYKCAQAFTSLTWQFSSVFYLGLKVHKGEVRIKAWHYPIKRRAEIATPKVLLNLGKSYSIFPLHLWMVLMAYFTFKIRHFCPAWNKVKEII